MADKNLSEHILPNAATMVGVCLTGISLVKLIEQRIGPSRVDEYLAADMIFFCASTLLSYVSLKAGGRSRARYYEALADYSFLVGMVGMVIISLLFAFEIV